jgi:hypothetical protein
MSYDIYLKNPDTGEPLLLDLPHPLRGGTYVVGGTTEAWLSITYNYSKHYYRLWPGDGIRIIYGMTGEESLPVLRAGAAQLGNDVSPDYWEPTEGNAKAALNDLITLAALLPDGVWAGD